MFFVNLDVSCTVVTVVYGVVDHVNNNITTNAHHTILLAIVTYTLLEYIIYNCSCPYATSPPFRSELNIVNDQGDEELFQFVNG